MAYVNLWELITFIAGHQEMHHADKCAAIEQECAKGAFSNMQEVSLEVSDTSWKIKLFCCGESPNAVELVVDRWMNVQVTRVRQVHDMLETRDLKL